jgi:hypothetical protein
MRELCPLNLSLLNVATMRLLSSDAVNARSVSLTLSVVNATSCTSTYRHGVDPQLYLTHLLINLPATRMNELAAWLPDQWKQLQADRMAILQSSAHLLRSHVVHVTLT